MTTDFRDPGSVSASNGFLPEAAKAASNLQVPVGDLARSLRVIDTGPHPDSAIFTKALQVLTHAVPNAAKHKNVSVQPQFHITVARDAMQALSMPDMRELLEAKPEAILKAQFAVSHALDLLAATMIAYLVAHLRNDAPPDTTAAAIFAQRWVEDERSQATTLPIIWPDLMDAALKYATVELADA